MSEELHRDYNNIRIYIYIYIYFFFFMSLSWLYIATGLIVISIFLTPEKGFHGTENNTE